MIRIIYHFILNILIITVFLSSAYSLEPLHEEELYDASGQSSSKPYYDNPYFGDDPYFGDPSSKIYNGEGTPKSSIQLDKNHTVHYFHQNVVFWESPGEITLSLKSTYYGDDGNFVALISPEPIRFIAEYDKYPFYPEGIGVSVSDIFYTGADGLPLPEYRKLDPNAPISLPPNTAYLRTRGAPVTITMLENRRDIVFAGEGENGEPDWEEAKKDRNRMFSIRQSYKARTETGYIYIWAHDTSSGP